LTCTSLSSAGVTLVKGPSLFLKEYISNRKTDKETAHKDGQYKHRQYKCIDK